MIRTELKDRFGEYPEEAEHLFQQIELKVIAAKMGFIKVELDGDVLALHFPPPEERAFYESDDAPFPENNGKYSRNESVSSTLKAGRQTIEINRTNQTQRESKGAVG